MTEQVNQALKNVVDAQEKLIEAMLADDKAFVCKRCNDTFYCGEEMPINVAIPTNMDWNSSSLPENRLCVTCNEEIKAEKRLPRELDHIGVDVVCRWCKEPMIGLSYNEAGYGDVATITIGHDVGDCVYVKMNHWPDLNWTENRTCLNGHCHNTVDLQP